MPELLPFSLAVFIASLWSLSTEMFEDASVDFIYARIFGVRRLVLSLIYSAIILTGLTSILVYIFRTELLPYLPFASKFSAVFLGAVGVYWLIFSLKNGKKAESADKSPFLLVFAEVLELFFILLPLSLTNHVQEAAASAIISVLVSLTSAFLLQRLFGNFLSKNLKIKYLKFLSGIILIFLAIILLY
jgi:putative Ca2+/H+ antiporter (TMEM165/GDT1 family)